MLQKKVAKLLDIFDQQYILCCPETILLYRFEYMATPEIIMLLLAAEDFLF